MAGHLPYPKDVTYRNAAILDAARHAPHCMNRMCRAPQHGQVVGCHSNSLRHGKGTGHKAHDLVAYLCDQCHAVVDGRPEGGPVLPRQERERIWADAFFETQLWLFQSGTAKRVA